MICVKQHSSRFGFSGLSLALTSALACGGLTAGSAHAAYIDVDFESDTAGQNPSAYVVEPAGTDVRIVDANSTPDDPFGGTGNQSLLTEDDSTSNNAYVSFQGAAGGLTQGTLTLDVYKTDTPAGPTNTGATYGQVRLGATNGGSSIAEIAIVFYMNGSAISGTGSGSTFDQTFTDDVAHVLEVTFDTTTDTWSGKLDGTQLTTGNSAVSSFSMNDVGSSIDAVDLSVAFSGRVDSRLFVDDIVMAVPEPASVALLGVGGLLLVGRRRFPPA